ncbi:MAG: site-2 protease family protein [Spirulinaceae cyanobacterium RM2_2_10]|nr:site-2 protease family protein [Spirulinaceae cyanobacterium SM2_1_0]NJO21412.1 site-2 protease family protein [Spirulinaceae cyanobacterium RM2_2_10]
MNGNLRVGNLFGIPFYVNPSWFLVLALGTLWFSEQFQIFSSLGAIAPWLLGFTTALLLFASVLAHELGHSFVAMRQGIGVNSITLFLFGGLAMLEKEAEKPLQALWVAIAGPLVSVGLFAVFTLIRLALPLPTPAAAMLYLLASINLVLALFNMIPGMPLDGGNVLKALVWKFTGNPNKGLLYASRVGQVFGWLAITVGLLAVLGITQYGSFWTLLIGWFLLQNAGRSAQSAQVQETLDGYTARDAVIPNSPIVQADLNLREFANNYVIGNQTWRQFLVTDAEGKLLGAIAVDRLRQIPTSVWPETPISQLVEPVDTDTIINADTSLLEIVKRIEQDKTPQLTVVDHENIAVGLLEKASIVRFLGQQAQSKDKEKLEEAVEVLPQS